jgi:hypothetical protein
MSRYALLCLAAGGLSGCVDSDHDGQPGEMAHPETTPLARSEEEQILDAVLQDILTNPRFKDDREFYGTPGDKRVALVSDDDYGVPWPKQYRPTLTGYTFCRVSAIRTDPDDVRVLGVRLDKYFGEGVAPVFPMSPPVAVCLFNAGGRKNGDAGGGCHYYYTPKKVADGWTVEFEGLEGQ